jgi:hypothetical protein
MADKVDKPKKKAKAKKEEKGVLASLSSTRPERIGGHRSATTTPKPARPKPVAAKPRRAAAKTSSRATSSRSTAARRKAAAPRTFEPTQAAESAAATSTASEPRPRAVSEGAPGIGTGGERDERSRESARPGGVEIATTAVKAAGEVAQLGLTIGGRLLKRVADRVPKP